MARHLGVDLKNRTKFIYDGHKRQWIFFLLGMENIQRALYGLYYGSYIKWGIMVVGR